MRPDYLQHRFDLLLRKPDLAQYSRYARHRVRHMIPARQLRRILRTVPHKHAQIVQPDRRKHYFSVIIQAGPHLLCQRIQPGLMPEFVYRTRRLANQIHQPVPKP